MTSASVAVPGVRVGTDYREDRGTVLDILDERARGAGVGYSVDSGPTGWAKDTSNVPVEWDYDCEIVWEPVEELYLVSKTKVLICLEIEHADDADPVYVVDELLDNGFFQDAINGHDVDDQGECHVVSATCNMGP